MTRHLATRIPAVLLVFLLTSCAALGTPRPGDTAPTDWSATNSTSTSAANNARTMDHGAKQNSAESDMVAQDGVSKTERAVGYIAMIGGVIALSLLAIAMYALVQAGSN